MAKTRYQAKEVAGFGGGLNFLGHSTVLRDDEWTMSDGWIARNGYAETLPRFVEVLGSFPNALGLLSTHRAIGIVPWPQHSDASALIGFVDTITPGSAAASNVRLFRINDVGVQIEQLFLGTDTAGGTTRLTGTADAVMQLAYLNGRYFVNCGYAGGSGYSVARFTTGSGNYQTLVPPGVASLQPAFLSSFAGHLIASYLARTQAGWRQVRVSDQGLETTWLPDIGNSADDFQLDNAQSGVLGQAPIAPNKLVLLMRDGVYALTPTGTFPPFTLELIARQGGRDVGPFFSGTAAGLHVQLCGVGGAGFLYRGSSDVHLLGVGAVGTNLADYVRVNDVALSSGRELVRPIVWDDVRDVYWVPMAPRDGGSQDEVFAFHPATKSWSRRRLPANNIWLRQQFVWDEIVGLDQRGHGRLWIVANSQAVHVEDAATTGGVAHPGNFVDTKDFSFGDPPRRVRIERLKVDWEGLETTNDSLFVEVWARDEWPIRGAAGHRSGVPPGIGGGVFTGVGTLGATNGSGQSEVATRIDGKFIRFRFSAPTARARIRGFSFHWRFLDDRRTP